MLRCFDRINPSSSLGFWVSCEWLGEIKTLFVCRWWCAPTALEYYEDAYAELPPERVYEILKEWGQIDDGRWILPPGKWS